MPCAKRVKFDACLCWEETVFYSLFAGQISRWHFNFFVSNEFKFLIFFLTDDFYDFYHIPLPIVICYTAELVKIPDTHCIYVYRDVNFPWKFVWKSLTKANVDKNKISIINFYRLRFNGPLFLLRFNICKIRTISLLDISFPLSRLFWCIGRKTASWKKGSNQG